MSLLSSFFSSRSAVFLAAFILRLSLLTYGHYQDQWSALKYTDIDYYVFTDAARDVAWGRSPYLRDTYRYTPLLAWLLVPTSWPGLWFDFGKVLFALSDVVAGWLMYRILSSTEGMSQSSALKFASIWLLNPMVAQISTRGSSEGLLIVLIMALLWSSLQRRYMLSGCLLGFAVHFKIFPFIYAGSILWWLEDETKVQIQTSKPKQARLLWGLISWARVSLAASSALTFFVLNVAMFLIYGRDFLDHTFFYHLIRSDHRHNFSPYNLLLYLNSSPAASSDWHPETFAFVPQIVLSAGLLPLALARIDLPSCMLAQTFAFVSFNKVCTSQYFLWYMAFLPFYLPRSTMVNNASTGFAALGLWIVGQALWLQQGYQLEFLGRSTFIHGLWLSSLGFFIVNAAILGIVVKDIRHLETSQRGASKEKER